jgi:RecA-family ATPase
MTYSSPNGKADGPKKKPLFELMTMVEEEETDFIWSNRIPRGKLTLFDGDPGVGKSYTALAIAAALSNGSPLPFDEAPEAPLRSWIISAEDGPADTVKPRLRKLGAEMSMIAIPNRELNFTPSQINATLIDRMLQELPAAMIVLDPILAYSGRRSTDSASDVRSLLQPLAIVAEKHRTAIILIRHLNKGTQNKALYRGQGSIDFAAVCRSAFIFAQDPTNEERRLMAHSKSSLGGLQPTLEFFIDKDSGAFRWGGETSESADEALGTGEPPKQRERVQLDRAKRFLEETLANGPKSSVMLEEEAEKLGLRRAIWRAKPELGIKARKASGGRFFWSLPER